MLYSARFGDLLPVCGFDPILTKYYGTKKFGVLVTALGNQRKIYFWFFVVPISTCCFTTWCCVHLKQWNQWKAACRFRLEINMESFIYFFISRVLQMGILELTHFSELYKHNFLSLFWTVMLSFRLVPLT